MVGIAAAGKLRHPMVMEQVGSSSTTYEEDLLLSGRSLSQSHPNLQPDAGYACRRLERVSRALVNSQTLVAFLLQISRCTKLRRRRGWRTISDPLLESFAGP